MDSALFRDMLCIDSTSGMERGFAKYLGSRLLFSGAGGVEGVAGCRIEKLEVGDGSLNLRLSWGCPRFYFCTHMDTVPPYIPPTFLKDRVLGRGSCDAKGQILAQFSACRLLEKRGFSDFGMLIFSGEEVGSLGAIAYDRDFSGAEMVLVGEPTDNCMACASKGTKGFEVTIRGKSCHSGYPEQGISAVEEFVIFMNKLHEIRFPLDPLLGATTYNVGKLSSDNPQNILSPYLGFRLYFRTTKLSDDFVQERMSEMSTNNIHIRPLGGDTPMEYTLCEGIPSKPVSFGSDAPRLSKFPKRALFGPGSILSAHTDGEYVLISDIEKAIAHNVAIAEDFFKRA